jgi:triacylglycerol esterase/lipase EstA (alpha/beta hydrolase family)
MERLLRAVAGLALASGALIAPGARVEAAPTSGVNDWACRPSPAHPHPVVLLHGLGAPAYEHMAYLGEHLADRGWCVFYETYGKTTPLFVFGGLAPVAVAAEEIAGHIDDVRAATGAAEVDLVGHSEGGFLTLYIPKELDFGGKVHRAFAIAPPTHGTTYAGVYGVADALGLRDQVDLVALLFGCGACVDLVIGGPGVQTLTTGPITVPGVEYTILASRTDLLVTPTDTAFVDEPGVDNRYVQDDCPLDPVGHFGLASDPSVAQILTNTLDPAHATPIRCAIGQPL